MPPAGTPALAQRAKPRRFDKDFDKMPFAYRIVTRAFHAPAFGALQRCAFRSPLRRCRSSSRR